MIIDSTTKKLCWPTTFSVANPILTRDYQIIVGNGLHYICIMIPELHCFFYVYGLSTFYDPVKLDDKSIRTIIAITENLVAILKEKRESDEGCNKLTCYVSDSYTDYADRYFTIHLIDTTDEYVSISTVKDYEDGCNEYKV